MTLERHRTLLRPCYLLALAAVVHLPASAHGQGAILPASVVVGASVAALLVAVFIGVAEANRLHRTTPGARGILRGALWMFAALGSWLAISLVGGALYSVVFEPMGMYPASVPFGFTLGTVALVLWYVKSAVSAGRRNMRHNMLFERIAYGARSPSR